MSNAGPGPDVGPAVLDDLDSRPGSATSLLRTIVGAHLRQVGGRITAAHLTTLLGQVGVGGPSARSAISRVKAKGLLVAADVHGRPGYALAARATTMLERGDRRLGAYRQQGEDDPWCLVSYTVPESRREVRHLLRRHLQGIGCGHVGTGLWICPAHLADELEQILGALGVRDEATVFVTGTPRVAGTFADAAATWWDLGRIADLHRGFLDRHLDDRHLDDEHLDDEHLDDEHLDGDGTAQHAFARWTRVLDDWRPVPYLDPGLPPSALPDGWPGGQAVATFDRLRGELADAARGHVRSVVAGPA